MKRNETNALLILLPMLLIGACQKKMENQRVSIQEFPSVNNSYMNANDHPVDDGAAITEIPLRLTIYNPCCQEEVQFSGIIHHVENSNVIHMDSRDISGTGLNSGLNYVAQSTSVRNYQFDPNEYLATLNWSIRLKREDGSVYNVQFVIHITRTTEGEVIANIHSGNFFCL